MTNTAKPFSCRTTDGVFVTGHSSKEEADASAKERNERAEALGVAARYEGTDQPAPS